MSVGRGGGWEWIGLVMITCHRPPFVDHIHIVMLVSLRVKMRIPSQDHCVTPDVECTITDMTAAQWAYEQKE